MIKKTNSGWILCPSKSYPGKFYYFNVLNGEAAWSSNDNEKKVFKQEFIIQKNKDNQLYPEPVPPPDHSRLMVSNYHSTIKTCLPTFGQVTFPKYISNVKENMEINCTSIQVPQLGINTIKIYDQNTQTEQKNINIHTCTIPMSKRFEKNINENFGYVAATQGNDWWNSTNTSNTGKHTDSSEIQYKRKLDTTPYIKASKLKRLEHTNKKVVLDTNAKQNSTKSLCNKVENSKEIPIILNINDLRYIRAKRRSVKMQDEHSTFNDSNKVTNNFRDSLFYSRKKYTVEAPPWYVVVDLEVLLQDYDGIKRYIDEDDNCRLYVPTVIRNQLKTLSVREHGSPSRVTIARQLLQQLESHMPELNVPQNKCDTTMHQIINCCLEIIKLNYDVVLVTKDIELLHTAQLYRIRAYHINDIKYNDLDYNSNDTYKYKQNLFLQNTRDFDPFTISKTVHKSQNYCRRNISDTDKDFIERRCTEPLKSDVSDISDIHLNINKLNINDNIFNIERKIKNDSFENKIVKISDKITCNENEFLMNGISDKKENINITFKNGTRNIQNIVGNDPPEHYTDVNVITNTLEDKLKPFCIKNNVMEHNLLARFDEFICWFEQILEDFLYVILQKNLRHVNQPPPWFLHEGMESLKQLYREKTYIINIIEKFLYYYDFSENGTNMKPYNFMKLFGCGFYLVEALEKTSPLHISDIKKKLIYLKDMTERPAEDELVESPTHQATEDAHTHSSHFVKNPSCVVDYLKKHFSEWKYHNEDYDITNQMEPEVHKDLKVLRTFGRHLNKLTINKSKRLSFMKETDKRTHNCDFPKVIRNIKLLDIFEEKMKRNRKELDYPEIAETRNSITTYCSGNENNAETNDFSINDIDINDSTKDVGVDSNSFHAYTLVRHFLSELSSSFKTVHTFIDESVKKYSEDLAGENKINLYEKANKTHTHMADIIDKLKIIIHRESLDNRTLQSLLIKEGGDDRRTARYRAVIMKCLEQATILENSLKLMLAITNEEVVSVSSAENIHFINIYEKV